MRGPRAAGSSDSNRGPPAPPSAKPAPAPCLCPGHLRVAGFRLPVPDMPRHGRGTMRPLLAVVALASLFTLPSATAATPAVPARDAVLKVVQDFFDALQAKDGARLTATCQPGAQITAVRLSPEGKPLLRQRTIEVDAEQVAKTKEQLLERMWSPTVLIEGRIAVVWTRYDFHRDGKMSHNGTDTFTLIDGEAGWKIVNAAYTVELSDRTQHPAGPPKS